MVVYLDVLFFVNALMDGATLLAAARLGGARIGRGRLVLAACLGGGYSVLAAWQPVLAAFPLRLLLGVVICAATFGVKTHFARICALYFITAGCFAGFAVGLGALSGRRLLCGAGYCFTVPLRMLVLALYFEQDNQRVCLCDYCWGYFIPKTKKATRYCDRVTDGQSCKQRGANLARLDKTSEDEALLVCKKLRDRM